GKHRMIALQKVHCRGVEHQEPSRPQHTKHFSDRRSFHFVVERVDHVERRDDVKGLSRERKVCNRRLRNSAIATAPGEAEPRPVEIDANCRAVTSKPSEIVTRAAATIENSSSRSGSYCLGDERDHEPAKSSEPEMIAFGSCSGL